MNHLAIGNEVYLTQKPTTCEGYSIIEKLMFMFQQKIRVCVLFVQGSCQVRQSITGRFRRKQAEKFQKSAPASSSVLQTVVSVRSLAVPNSAMRSGAQVYKSAKTGVQSLKSHVNSILARICVMRGRL